MNARLESDGVECLGLPGMIHNMLELADRDLGKELPKGLGALKNGVNIFAGSCRCA